MTDHVRPVAVVPCAGLGTRLRPLTWAVPKELLPYGPKTLLDHTLHELCRAGVERAIVVTRAGKEALREHVERAGVPSGLRVEFVVQQQPRGLADALRAARRALNGAPLLMALPDQQLSDASGQLVHYYRGQASLASLAQVPETELHYFPGAAGLEFDGPGPVHRVRGVLQPSCCGTLRAFGRTVFDSKFLELLPEQGEESDLGRCFLTYLQQGQHDCIALAGRPADLGTMAGYLHYASLVEPDFVD
ncbi:NTP transferase domain-containing protein [bacterium]|nr:NTP transferase domain-containing protein [bacterium]